MTGHRTSAGAPTGVHVAAVQHGVRGELQEDLAQQQLVRALLRHDPEGDVHRPRSAEGQAELLGDGEGAHRVEVGQGQLPQVAPGRAAAAGEQALHLAGQLPAQAEHGPRQRGEPVRRGGADVQPGGDLVDRGLVPARGVVQFGQPGPHLGVADQRHGPAEQLPVAGLQRGEGGQPGRRTLPLGGEGGLVQLDQQRCPRHDASPELSRTTRHSTPVCP